MYMFSVKVMEEVKSDVLYEFQPPFNILAGLVIWPSSWIFSVDNTIKISRAMLRILYFPELLIIYIYELLILSKQPQYMPERPGRLHNNFFPFRHNHNINNNNNPYALHNRQNSTSDG